MSKNLWRKDLGILTKVNTKVDYSDKNEALK